jgi:hypothetical protein
MDYKVTIELKENEEIDLTSGFFISEDGIVILACDERPDDNECFSGAIVDPGNSGYEKGDYSTSWEKYAFKPFKGKLIIEQ